MIIGKNKFINAISEIPDNSKLCLYGDCILLKRIGALIKASENNLKVSYYIYDNKQAQKTVQIINIDNIESYKNEFDFVIIISSKWRENEKILRNKGIYQYYIMSGDFPYACFKNYEKIKKYINETKNLLSSSKDKELYEVLLKSRTDGIKPLAEYYSRSVCLSEVKYLNFVNMDKINTIIHAGVFDGFSLFYFLNVIKKGGVIYGFEPDYNYYNSSKYKIILDDYPNIKVYPLALWEKSKDIPFKTGGSGSSSVAKRQEYTDNKVKVIEAISIDDFISKNNINKVDFIALDIEKAELKVLKGAVNTLKAHRPQLAICIYHDSEHLYRIPLFLKSVLSNYQYRIGHYTPYYYETIWYAIPEESLKDTNL